MAVPNIHNLTLIPLGLLVISRIYRAEGNGVCGDQKPKIIKETNFWSFTWGSSFANWSIWILLFAFGVIIITAIIARAVARYRKILPLSAPTSPYSLDGNESDRRLPSPIHRKTPTMSRHQFVDTSDRKYEIYVPQKGMAGNDFSLGRTANSTKERTVNMEEVDYLHILE
ncbi:hypothetical protein HOLleu_34409 [Holothuria leucospilota]|uniref:Uncharacterized protein n=1 Tax=Holothuria leucospilota TaxID=206669 RepID=A0A9Q0YL03_HOLLE|nr:hypothetical protein HOLleu_34409 [Holothuria leucospilota]